MSAKLAMRVFESDLPPRLKATATVLALFADAEGGRIYPSAERLAWLVGKAERHVREDLSTLRHLGVLAAITPTRLHERTGIAVPIGGRHGTTGYRLDIGALPSREPWRSQKGGRSRQGFQAQKPDAGVMVSPSQNPDLRVRVSADERVTLATERVTLASEKDDASVIRSVSDPLVDPLDDVVAAVLAQYTAGFRTKVGSHPKIKDRDRNAVKSLLRHHAPELVQRALAAMFDHGDRYTVESGFSLALFHDQFNRYLAQAKPERPDPTPFVDQFHSPGCSDYAVCSQRRREEREAQITARARGRR